MGFDGSPVPRTQGPRCVPTAADYRRQGALRERWQTAGALAAVAGAAALVFWLVPPAGTHGAHSTAPPPAFASR